MEYHVIKMKKAEILFLVIAVAMSLASCDRTNTSADKISGPVVTVTSEIIGEENNMSYKSITMDEAKELFETPGDYVILDVRRSDEFAEGHIPDAVNIANEDITDTEPSGLPDKNQLIYVYCRSGNRSKQASEKLAAMGYTNIVEFGGITDWKGEIVK
ncbi:MAG: rhodanese-like domain-containing protein [Oscillospiraceae bacterium]|nr:rhodanese-like domain-containing protein [Oscillospiraceae bacterium]